MKFCFQKSVNFIREVNFSCHVHRRPEREQKCQVIKQCQLLLMNWLVFSPTHKVKPSSTFTSNSHLARSSTKRVLQDGTAPENFSPQL